MKENLLSDDCMNIVYASDDNFAEIMGVSIVSLFENNVEMEIELYILDSGISEKNKEKIHQICEQYSRKHPNWIQAINISEVIGMDVNADRGSLSQYVRVFVSSLLPSTLTRILYLDCDTIINQSIQKLWTLDLKNNTIAALKDAFSKTYRANIGLEEEDIMFNSGVILIDMNKWRENNVEKRILEFIQSRNGNVQQGDQGVLNAVLSRETFVIEPRFNSVTIFYDFTYDDMLIYRRPVNPYSREEIKRAVEEPVIIHYTTSFLSKRPWFEGCQHKYRDTWIKYRQLSPWKDQEFREYNSSMYKRTFVIFYNFMPIQLSVRIAGVLQAKVRPSINRYLMK